VLGDALQFVKMHGAGNDFVLLDVLKPQTVLESGSFVDDARWARLAREMCDRHFGIGSDGLLLALPSTIADARMRMFNPDGSESASCGNGIRCLGRYVRDRYGLGAGDLRVETGAGVTTISVLDGGMVTVNMGLPVFAPAQIPTAFSGDDALDESITVGSDRIPIGCVSMGNPHAVTFVEPGALDAYPLETIGPKVERHPSFPERTNFEVCEVVAPDHMRVRVWERGAGVTLACGTGACASTVVATRAGRIRPPIRLELPGGTLTINWAPGEPVLMTGPTEYVFAGTYPMPSWWSKPGETSGEARIAKREAAVVG